MSKTDFWACLLLILLIVGLFVAEVQFGLGR
jgi:hypothetical protein